jgi:hypothetical protein
MRGTRTRAGIRLRAGNLPVLLLASAGGFGAGCSRPPAPVPKAAEPVRITQFYSNALNVAKGDKALVCYGVENARTVWLDPPRQSLSAALARCVEVTPAVTTTYTLTAEGADGKSATKSLTLPVGPPAAKIVNVNVSSIEVKRGDPVTICYTAENARSVTIEPLHYAGGAKPKGCVGDKPLKSTTYVITAIGSAGDRDREEVTVKVP